jgi:O-antigen/teichoic acid export membrane protein
MVDNYDQAAYGEYQYALAISILLGIVLQFSDDKVIKHLFHTAGVAQTFVSTIILKILLSIILVSFYILLEWLGIVDGNPAIYLKYFIIAAMIIGISYAAMTYFDYKLVSKKRAQAVITGNVATFCVQAYFIFSGYSIQYVAISVIFGAILTTIMMFLMLKDLKLTSKFKFRFKNMKTIFLRSIPFTLAAAAHMIYMRTDLIMIEYFKDYSSVAIYSVSMQLMALVAILISPLQVTLFSKLLLFYDESQSVYYKKYFYITKIVTMLGFVLILLGLMLIVPFIDLFLDNKYLGISDFFYLHMMSVLVMYNAALRSSHITLIKRGYVILISQIISLVLNIILNYLLIPYYGLWGAAFSTFLTIIISLLLSNYLFSATRKIFWIQLAAFFPWSKGVAGNSEVLR